MIRLQKQPEPKVLVDNAEAWTKNLIEYQQAGTPVPKSLANKYNHPDVKQALQQETDEELKNDKEYSFCIRDMAKNFHAFQRDKISP